MKIILKDRYGSILGSLFRNQILLLVGWLGVSGSLWSQIKSSSVLSLNGAWTVTLGQPDSFTHTIQLPGTLDDAGIGTAIDLKPILDISTLGHLTRKVQYVGKAKYSKMVRIPKGWGGKKIILTLGRVLWKSNIAIDGKEISQTGESLVQSHEFDLTGILIPGQEHRLTITIDNNNIYPGTNIYAKQYASDQSREMMHGYTNHTQIKWNGIIGDILLKAMNPVHIEQVDLTPTLKEKQLKAQIRINNRLNETYCLKAFVRDLRTGKKWPQQINLTGSDQHTIKATIPFGPNVVYWNEFHPQQYELVTILTSPNGNDTSATYFGLREIATADAAIFLNGNRLFLRGNLECIIFPKTGYPPMDKDSWKKLFQRARNYGLNSFRFHSWCPPSAAFAAADDLGFYLQVELPNWNLKVGEDTAAFNFLRREAFRIIRTYGNHPSFLFMTMGNELEGNVAMLTELVNELKALDKRHLYATTTFSFQAGVTGIPQEGDDFYITQWTKKGWVRGQGIFNDKPPVFSDDFREAAGELNLPVISHEIGQYSVFPDITEIEKYTGNLVPLNFISIKEDLKKKGMLHLAPEYLDASGRLAALLYKEEIERALKTPGFDGFQLLQLQDFPGQGTALVGMLNAFWESKGFITPEEFREFCSEVTPLIRFPKAIYTNQEQFIATVELANFYQPLNQQELYWKLLDENSRPIAGASLGKFNFPLGNCLPAGTIKADLRGITKASRLTIEVGLKGTGYRNRWSVWVYPDSLNTNTGEIIVTRSKQEALAALKKGKRVLLHPFPDSLKGVQGKFVPVFWSPVHFPDQPGTMGMLIKKQHPALKGFPTDAHTNWQWWDLTVNSKTLVVKGLPEEAFIIRVIDNFVRNENLSNLLELKVGNGKLLLCAMDIESDLSNRLPARQLKYSLLEYMNSSAFDPSITVDDNFLQQLFK